MKDAVITVPIPRAVRKRLETLARREGGAGGAAHTAASRRARTLKGLFEGARVPTLAEFREIRGALPGSLLARAGRDEKPRR